jgi:hypothetical protein
MVDWYITKAAIAGNPLIMDLELRVHKHGLTSPKLAINSKTV